MKIIKVIVSFVAVAVLAMMFTADLSAKKKNADEGKAEIKFDEYVYDFGNVKEQGGPVSHEFEFMNTGNGNLVIVTATAECGCTRPDFPKNPIAPGKKGKVKVTYNPIGRPGSFEKVVTLKTNGQPKKLRLKVRGAVVPGKK